jgi:arabinogalactan oligomer / maltooligosaccharide transport system permease protein
MKDSRTSSIVLHNLLIAVLAFIWLIPIIWLLCTSFSAYSGMNTSTFFPKEWSISNYMKLFHSDSVSQFPQWFLNTFFTIIFNTLSNFKTHYSRCLLLFSVKADGI